MRLLQWSRPVLSNCWPSTGVHDEAEQKIGLIAGPPAASHSPAEATAVGRRAFEAEGGVWVPHPVALAFPAVPRPNAKESKRSTSPWLVSRTEPALSFVVNFDRLGRYSLTARGFVSCGVLRDPQDELVAGEA
jgi:hypothetical protein